MDAPHQPTLQPNGTNPDNQREPLILSDLTLDDAPENQDIPGSTRALPITLLISLSAHLILLALAAYTVNRDISRVEQASVQPSIEIRLQASPPRTTATSNNQELQSEPASNDEATSNETDPPVEIRTAEPAVIPPESIAQQPALAEEPIAPTAPPPPIQVPSLTDLRTAARTRAEQDRQSRSTHPDCLINERRNNYLDCGDEQDYDYASADRNDTYAFFNPTVPAEPDNDTEQRTSTSARVKAAIDMFDNQLGTTQTKKRLLYVP